MPSRDWLIGRNRQAEASDRIYAAAAELIARDGVDAFTIEALASKIHCSPATIYRHAGGKGAIREAVIGIISARIVDLVRENIRTLEGPDRVVTAVVVALRRIRSHPLGPMVIGSIRNGRDGEWVTESPVVEQLAEEMIGGTQADSVAAQWLLRVVLALWCWPVKDPEVEYQMLKNFLGPAFAGGE
ncbi:TetR/AcrR family transcriptional regulator [Nocardia sp. CA2R105]|uniref:TetR/AcrR family transcriptional regulator n=1 Tax=Nocardia coffeae TaxID=2873381 RepID=UPI001CA7915F|nr:helix-turn-helix domain-containing protein [Nocardia coffeae]MBY8856582.1 TetR/AcrR family transcriptional regulator [Nocardia coffeae]